MSRSRSPGGRDDRSPGGDHDERLARLRGQLEDFTNKHKLDDRANRIMTNMHPVDAKKVMATPFPKDCRSSTAFVVSVIRKVENEAGRPQGYRWDGRSWSEPKARGRDSRSPSRGGGRGGGGRRRRSRSYSRPRGHRERRRRRESSDSR
mmetsp:Transcript_86897/g.246407  ORF Transcript_86897/g.246407 Transcript_86897/m.246407 type:complete len:149 (-) Transcript_86897:154-600(-)